MSWGLGLMLICIAYVILWVAAEILNDFGSDDWDEAAEQKRRNHDKATKAAGELRHHR